jgi:hypothetical protein
MRKAHQARKSRLPKLMGVGALQAQIAIANHPARRQPGWAAWVCNRSAEAIVVAEATGVRLTAAACGRRTRHANPTAGRLQPPAQRTRAHCHGRKHAP